MKLIIAGSRTLRPTFEDIDRALAEAGWKPTLVLCGDCRGPDLFGAMWATRQGIPVERFPADWNNLSVPDALVRGPAGRRYNAAAGPQRNQRMAVAADAALVFKATSGPTRGTNDLLRCMKRLGRPVHVVRLSTPAELRPHP